MKIGPIRLGGRSPVEANPWDAFSVALPDIIDRTMPQSSYNRAILLSVAWAGVSAAKDCSSIFPSLIPARLTQDQIGLAARPFALSMAWRWANNTSQTSEQRDEQWAALASVIDRLLAPGAQSTEAERTAIAKQCRAGHEGLQLGDLAWRRTEEDLVLALAARALGTGPGFAVSADSFPVRGAYELWGLGIPVHATDVHEVTCLSTAMLASEAAMPETLKLLSTPARR